jgi:YggT family protein
MPIVLIQAASFLIQSLFNFYLVLLLLRILLQKARANFHNPFCQFIVKLTNPPLLPLRRVIPGYRGIDFAAILLLFAIQMVEIYLLYGLLGVVPNIAGVLVTAVGELLYLLIYTYMVGIFIQMVLSWIAPHAYRNPFNEILSLVLEPIMAPARRIVPPVSGLDFSPMLAILVLGVVHIVVVNPILALGAYWM